ncbi:GGDEF domain-containing protein [Massilia aurea]|uniref:GGDEF domain-containing protein n=1 Tax=Massilia aurea TaxID=373040 RepID=UPI0021618BCB|nr:GGDEF domain-containing protein [Massilia aurea]MCS0707860.1 GGDEF domain-containing protein [Massilia aurea]
MEQIGTFGTSRTTINDLQLFRDETDPDVAAMLADCAIVRLPKGERIDDSGQAHLYIVLSGQLEIESDAHAGDETGTTRVLPGESVGDQAVLDDAANLAAMTALEDSELLVIESSVVWSLIDRSSVLARNLLRLLSFRIRTTNALLRRRQKLGEFYRQLSLNDPLTGLYNRAWLNDMLPKLAARAARTGSGLSIVMIDLDHFKQFNDTHGHIIGDVALSAAASLIRDALRPSDFAVRFGGEEMLAVLPDTGIELATMVAERLCQRLRDTVVFTDMRVELPHLTASFGVASLGENGDEYALMAAADAALYRAKEAGRNRVCN